MESFNNLAPYHQDSFLAEASKMVNQITTGRGHRSSRRPSLRTNFSYPKLVRHGSNESRSSNGSIPGMTDTSDCDLSFDEVDEDGIYNTSAGELWDSFWPDDAESSSIYRQSHESHLPLLQPRQRKDYLKINPTGRSPFGPDDETIKIATDECDYWEEEPPSPRTSIQPPLLGSTPLLSTPPRPVQKRSPVTYSIYPTPQPVASVPRLPHPPRTSSLSFEPRSSPRRPSFLLNSRSSAALKASKSIHNMNSLFIAPSTMPHNNKVSVSQECPPTTAKKAASVPVSPVYPPPPTPRTLRPSTSAFNLRDKVRSRSESKGSALHNHNHSNNATAPLAPLLPSPLPEPIPPTPATRPQFVSVFELDSDSESETEAADEGPSFARRIARGLHKRSTIEKRGGVAERKVSGSAAVAAAGLNAATLYAGPSEKYGGDRGGSLSRKRGGSLGRIFGLIGM
ncbi:hypothetical protein F5Y09DRAFT_292696 [Xylaria sp. FL1042]|nr:hypothetical protein F5Y09DRAFT_292696 [Xylaria sp. FL1042]